MALTRSFRETVKARARRDPAFRQALLREAIECMLAGDMQTGKLLLRNYINATAGFGELAKATDKSAKNLMRMLSPRGNPGAYNVFRIFELAQRKEGIRLSVIPRARRGVRRPATKNASRRPGRARPNHHNV
jgi:DNA-binding phage protein